jgi:hypothetical protein
VSGKGKSKTPVNDALGADGLTSYLTRLAQEKEGDGQLTVAVVGVTNVSVFSFHSYIQQFHSSIHSFLCFYFGIGWQELCHQLLDETSIATRVLVIH